jgi:predicted transcriptional regulator
MTETTTMTVRLPRATLDGLASLARSTRRTRSFLAAEAIAEYVAANAWQVEEIRKAVEEADGGGAFHDHEDVMDYLARRGHGERPARPRPVLPTR